MCVWGRRLTEGLLSLFALLHGLHMALAEAGAGEPQEVVLPLELSYLVLGEGGREGEKEGGREGEKEGRREGGGYIYTYNVLVSVQLGAYKWCRLLIQLYSTHTSVCCIRSP